MNPTTFPGLVAALLVLGPGLRFQAETGTVTDVDGNVYRTVRIGEQWWMAENLRVTHDPEGNPIPSFCYGDDPANEQTYGRLYTWETAMDSTRSPGARGIAPEGWRIPSDEDWQEIFACLSGIEVAGGKLKERGTCLWNPPNRGATNASGFSARPAGGWSPTGYEGLGVGTHFWSSSERGARAPIPSLHCEEEAVLIFEIPKSFAHSVRCVRATRSAGNRPDRSAPPDE
jgi:uncharacterized protein (TIGR02145 family)